MKSKRRHDLQTNQLADWIGKKIEKVKPYSNLIVLGTLVALVVIVGVVFLINRRNSQAARDWGLYTIQANMREPDPAELTKVAQSDPDSPPHLWALQAAADAQSSKGIELLYTEREKGMKELDRARKTYETILERVDDDPLLQRRARYGLAKTLESMGELEAARKQYMELASAAQGFAIGKLAKRQVERLADPSLSAFYDKFAKLDQTDSSRSEFEPTFLPERPDIRFPGDYLPLPERPDISFPEPVEATGGGGQFNPVDAATDDDDHSAGGDSSENVNDPVTPTPDVNPDGSVPRESADESN